MAICWRCCWEDLWDNLGVEKLKITLEIQDGNWRWWLQPITSFGPRKSDRLASTDYENELRLQFLTIKEGHLSDQTVQYMTDISALTEAFRRTERRFEEAGKTEYFYYTIQHLLDEELLNFEKEDDDFGYVFYTALYLYLQRGALYREIKAHTTFAFCVWQRYNLAKRLYGLSEDVNSEIVLAYQELSRLLCDPEFTYDFRLLWSRIPKTEKEQPEVAPSEFVCTDLHISAFLDPVDYCGVHKLSKPLPAPLCSQSCGSRWDELEFHQRFRRHDGQMAIRKFIRNWLFPRYSLCNAIHLAGMLARDKVKKRLIWFGAVLFLCLLTLVIFRHAMFDSLIKGNSRGVPVLVLEVLVPAIVITAFLKLDFYSVFDILMPRLWGGIFIGYMPLVISEEAWYLGTIFCSRQGNGAIYALKWPYATWLVILWLFSIALSLLYFVKEALVYTNTWKKALRRALAVWLWAVLVALFLGVILCQLGYPIRESMDTVLEQDGVQPLRFEREFRGILGKSIPYQILLTFAPLSLLIGIMVQIIWEEKPITATVWVPEER